MKKRFLQLSVIVAALVFQSCSKPTAETKLDKYDLTFTSVQLSDVPEFMDTKVSETDTDLSNYDFNIGGHARVTIGEITESVYPVNLDMLKKAITESPDFVELIDAKQLKNGAFGVIFKEKGSDGTSIIKDYRFYFKKGNRFFKMRPVFNSELKDLDKQIAAYESLK
ncbi:hypothetical protein [Ferruginibacter sp. HRS2-29]|uniref:hypothetical protein n=1 Tax=Ferruginibacter sp. HRS2-29 TaxID=2487334 RepID=UPI0020CD6C94|nr:hypothetical protein [Ferruginibacter sp. HRS2-29]MCP9750571.1 hypothetical protein [Ferruginibacter sp. HRS2-29]